MCLQTCDSIWEVLEIMCGGEGREGKGNGREGKEEGNQWIDKNDTCLSHVVYVLCVLHLRSCIRREVVCEV